MIYLGILFIRDGQMTLGEFLYFHGSVGFLFGPVVSLSNMNIMLQWVMTALHRIFEVLDEDKNPHLVPSLYQPEYLVSKNLVVYLLLVRR